MNDVTAPCRSSVANRPLKTSGVTLVGLVDAAAAVGADDPLRLAVGDRRAAREPLGEAHPLLLELVVGDARG